MNKPLGGPADAPSAERYGNYLFDFARREVRTASGERLDLRHQPLQVLFFLARNVGREVTKDEILAACWPNLTVGEDSLTQAVSEIRRVLGEDGRQMIRTVPKRGYVFIPPEASPIAPPREIAPAPAAEPAPVRRSGGARRLLALAVLVLLAAAGVAIGWWTGGGDQRTGGEPALLAVQPFENMSGDPALQYFVDGTTENLIASLARSPDIRVVGGSVVQSLMAAGGDPRRVHDELGALYLLTGSVQKRPDAVRIVAELVDTRTGQHVWAERYDRSGADPYAVQDGVVESIIRTVAGDAGLITKREYQKAWGKDEGSLAEFDYYLRGHSRFMTFTREGLDDSERIWTEGLKRYPNSALLKVKLAYVGFVRVQSGWVQDPEAILGASWTLGTEALAQTEITPLAQTLGHMLMSELNFYYKKDFAQALKERERTLQLSPNDFFMIADLAYVAVGSGQPQVGVDSLKDITPYQPMADWGYAALAWGHFALRNYEKSIEAANAALAPVPIYASAFEAASWVELGDMEKAKAAYAELVAAVPDVNEALIRQVHLNADREVVDREIAALKKLGLPPG